VGAVAVIGMACRLPGAESCEQYWANLRSGRNLIREIPPDRWDVARYYSADSSVPNTANSKWGGLLDQVDRFDHRFFGLSAREARSMDPQQRLLLEEAWHCLEDAGIPQARLKQRTTSVYVGVMTIDYHQNVTAPSVEIDSYACLGNYAGILANRLSNVFGWTGESYALDAACAGSLTALHQARRALLAGECDYALVAGVSLLINPWHYVSFAKSRMLSPDGQCRTFDRDANGYVPGEGVSVLLLCREEDALGQGARLHGRVLGTATSHVGLSTSITAPSVAAQRRVIESAATAAGVGLDTISYIEAHGTGTPLGDPIEIAALSEALGSRATPCRIGSVKTAVGHLEAAAGLAGVIKVLLMMRERTLAPTLNLDLHNPLIDFATGPLRPVTACEPWEGEVLRAGISAFGFGGTNAHAIIEVVAPPKATPSDEAIAVPFVLSARSPESFRALWLAWRDFSTSPAFEALALADILGTQACGREALAYRWAAVVSDKDTLRRELAQEPPTPHRIAGMPRLLLRLDRGDDGLRLLEQVGVRPIAVESTASGTDSPIARFDRKSGRMHLPWALDAVYLAALREGLVGPAADTDRVVQRARDLAQSNFTFRGYLGDWQRALGTRGDMQDWLSAPPRDETLRRLLLLGCIASSWRLSRRWGLPAPRDMPSEAWGELGRLIADGLLENDESVALVEAETAAFRLAPLVAARALATAPVDYAILSRHSAERAGVVAMAEPPADLVVDLGDEEPRVLLARLWQAGVDVDWSALQSAYQVVSLPLYPFDRHRHWLDLEAAPALLPAAAPIDIAAAPMVDMLDRLDAYAAHCAFVALERAGALTSLGIGLARSEIVRRCLKLPRYRPLLDAAMEMLARRGLAATDGEQVRALIARREAAATASALRDALDAESSDAAALAAIVERCARALPAVLAGDSMAEDVLFPAGDSSQVEHLLSGHAEARRSTGRMAAAVAEAASRRAEATPQARVRILEVGAGTGLATQAVLDALGPMAGRFDYVCTDRSAALLEAARARLAGKAGGLRFERLDLVAPGPSDDALGHFDIVIAANVMHALPRIGDGLRHLKARLGAGGVLVLDEPTRLRDALTITLGLLSDWWRADPARIVPGALLSSVRWQEVLRESFAEVDLSGDEDRSVIVARTAAAPAVVAEPANDLLPVVLHAVAEAIDGDPAGIDHAARFADIGVDSLAAGDVARLLSMALGRPIAAHVIDDHATPIRLALYLAGQVDVPPAKAVAPAAPTSLEAMIVEIIAAVTETDRASIDSRLRFVELGVESILAGDAAQILSKRLGRAISPAVFNEHPTISALARYLDGAVPPPAVAAVTQAWELAERGNLSSLAPHDSARPSPGPGEVEIEVIAAGLNFRDVMEALGRIGDEARPLGLEFAGRVTAVGGGVTGLSPGDEVVGLKIGCLARHVVTRAALVAPKPARLSFAEAAGLPIVFLTAAATLERIAKLGPGKTVLVHAGTGGVGLAALQIARAAGATVLATAGSPEKRAYLQALGVDCVADSRSTSFADAVRRATGGAGVDAVLNCLAGAMTDAGLALVRPGGSFIEIGKTDIRPTAEIAGRHPRIAYTVYDLLGELDQDPGKVGRELGALMKRFTPGGLTALPVRCFRFEEAATALRFLSRARHIGKVAIGVEAVEPVMPVAASQPVIAPLPPPAPPLTEPVAIVGMAGCFPGAPDLGAFWKLLREGADTVGEVPAGRWSSREFAASGITGMGESRHRAGGFLADAESFDAALFGISPREALLMDPQQRVLLEQAWLALADAGIRTDGQSTARTGVFVGASASDYSHKAAILGVPPDRPSLLAQMPSSLAARLGYVFDLKGPALTVDMGCASAVAAIKLATDALRRGEVDVAVAGAVAVQSTPLLALSADQSEILSADGRCRSFSANAGGLGLSEGAGVIVLKRLSDATGAGDTIHAVIRSASVSQNGATNGMSAPSVSAQVAQARNAFAESGIAPDSVSYVEGHGVGTKAGDSAEIAALAEVFGAGRALPIGSVKSNIGHTLAAAGMAGLFKVVLQLRHGILAPSLHADAGAVPELAATRLAVNTRLAPWTVPSGTPRRAAINSFAINGGNGFMLVEQAPAVARQRAALPASGVLLLFAGRTEAALREQLGALAQQLAETPVDLADLACTFNAAAPGMTWRAAFVAADVAALISQLREPTRWCLAQAKRRDAETAPVFDALASQLCTEGNRAKLLAAAQLYVDGADFTVPPLPGAQRINLMPSRRFARQRYWLGEDEARPAVTSMPVATARPGEDRRLIALREAASAVLDIPVAQLGDDAVLPRLGLDSLLAFELRGRLTRSLGATPEPADLLADRTLAELAAVLPSGGTAVSIATAPDARHEPFPLTDIQLAYWLGRSSEFALGGSCHVYWEFAVHGARDVGRLEEALNTLIGRHDMLRAVVGADGTQRVLPSVPRYRIERRDWRNGDAEEGLAALRSEMAQESFDPAQWPLFRVVTSHDGAQSRVHLGVDLLIIDVPSLALLLDQWGRLYREPGTILPAPGITFRDYVLHLKQQEKGAAYQASRAYWSERIPALPPAPRLADMKPFDARKRWDWKRHRDVLDAAAWSALQQQARAAGLTPVAALVTAFGEVLARVAMERRFTLNLTVNDRQHLHPDIANVVGDFTSTVLLGLDLATPAPFVHQAQAAGRDLADHLGRASFTGVKVLQQRGGSGAGALMPVVFTSMLGYGALSRSLGRLDFGATRTPQVWLDAQVMEDDGALVVTWDSIDALFPDGLLAGTFAAWMASLRGLAADAALWQRPLGVWLDEQERARRVRRNATDHPMVEDLLHEPFLRQALAHPERVAVVAPDRTLTYGELLGYALAVADALGPVTPDHLVAVAAPKGWQQIAGAIGVLLAGGAYLPVDPALPMARRHHLLARAEARIVLTADGTPADWPADVRTITVGSLAPAPLPTVLLPRRAAPANLAYVIFTSGSTGEPKGVMIEHRAALNTVLDCNDRYAVGPRDRVLGLSALGFDLSVYDIFGLLGAGGALVLPEARSAGDPAHLAKLIRTHDVTLWNSVPMFAQLFLEGGREAAETLAGVRMVMMSGDWIPLDLPPRLREANPAIELISMGGATEASIWSIAYAIGAAAPGWASVPYGYPMRNQRFHVLDEQMKDCPDWIAGELYIAGEGLARGYWRAPDITAARFVTHPVTGERLYRTGDLGRYREDGVIEFLGRNDGQVKVGGYRIELGEIETALARHPAVRQAAVVVRGDPEGRKSLAAFYVGPAEAAALRAHLGETLPGYMVPASFQRLDALPLNVNEKIDRKALAAWREQEAPPVQAITVPARAAPPPRIDAVTLEARILEIWREVLVNPMLPADEKLAEHGAHSFHAVEANARINRALQIGCTVTDIFEFATVRALAAALAGRQVPVPEAVAAVEMNGHGVPPMAARSQRRRQFRASLSG
jgi:amino acid adenylation domain-containing protein